jgi:hypothetical protein
VNGLYYGARRVDTRVLDGPIGAPIQPHASAWGYFHARNTPKLTHGANRSEGAVARGMCREECVGHKAGEQS